ncbi:MAG: HD domain-containing protein, partial [Nitrosopumilus sp.]|nr:HD domain-containing protein [Nitrosopumilus sp.]
MLLDFFNTVINLKNIPRQGWIDKLGLETPESVSDHTFSMTVMSLIFSEIQKLDTLKVLKMSLIHDLTESFT